MKVCIHICRCYRVSAQFEACREAIVEVPGIVKDLCRVLYFKVSVAMGLGTPVLLYMALPLTR